MNKDKTPLYKKPMKEIKQFPFMTKYAAERADDDDDDDNFNARHKNKKKDDSLGGFDDF